MIKLITALAMASLLVACGGPTSLAGKGLELFDPAGFKVVPAKADAVISQRQLLPSYQRCLGLTDAQIGTNTKNAISESITNFSLDGSPTTVSGPMMMSFVKIAGELCLNVIDAEKSSSTRKYFPGFDFTAISGTANTQPFNMSNTIQKFASNCWGRSATSDEINLVISSATSAGAAIYSGTQASAKKDAALFVCTTVLSSSQAIRR